jgi:hypothetical protein
VLGLGRLVDHSGKTSSLVAQSAGEARGHRQD